MLPLIIRLFALCFAVLDASPTTLTRVPYGALPAVVPVSFPISLFNTFSPFDSQLEEC